jgi:catechol 2,3-dioxygenase-like lactoylglutathione lyase family enzyme
MQEQLDVLLNQYERGVLSRREVLFGLTALATTSAASSAQAAQAPLGTVKTLNHITAFVPDVQKSAAFYQELLGMPILTKQNAGINLSAGTGFFGIYPARNGGAASYNHLCFGMENFNADAVLKQLKDRGLQAYIRMRDDTQELYFTDPDGLSVQLQDVKYKGGTGVLGDKDPK